MIIDSKATQQVIDKLLSTPTCLDSIRNLKCARFGAFVRVKCGIILLSSIDWAKVAQAMESAL